MNITKYGTVNNSAEEILENIKNIFVNVFGISPDTTSGNSTNLFIQELTNMAISYQNQYTLLTGEIYNPNKAQGVFLDSLCSILNFYRNPATYSTVTCEITGLSGTLVPVNSIVINPTTNDQFASTTNILISSNGTGTGLFKAVKIGTVAVDANTITQIQQNIPGWSTVNNSTAGTIGTLTQNDTQLRNIRKYALAKNSVGWFNAMNASLVDFMNQFGASVDADGNKYVLGYYIFENSTDLPVALPKDTITILPHSIYITIYAPNFIPNHLENQQYLAGILLNSKSAGCQTQNLQTDVAQKYNVDYINTKWSNAHPVNIKWDSPTPIPLQFNISIILVNPVTDLNTFENNIKKAIVFQFYNGYDNHPPMKMVENINSADYYPIIFDTVGNLGITSFTIQQLSDGLAPSNIFIGLSPLYIPTLNSANIIINIVT